MDNPLINPLWVTLKENGDLIKMEAKEQVALLKAELELYGALARDTQTKSDTSYTPFSSKEKWQYSLDGFHNPRKHKGLSPLQFLKLYLNRKVPTDYKIQYINSHRKEALTYIESQFTRTLTG